MLKNILLLGTIFLLLFSSFFPISFGFNANIKDLKELSSNRSNIFYVGGSGPNNYTKIQDAVDDAMDGDTVFIYDDSSPYYGNIWINRTINVIGENKETTVIDGKKTKDDGFIVNSENTTIHSLTIKDFRFNDRYLPWAQAGIKIYASNVKVNSCKLISNRIGIEVYTGAHNITIANNELINDGVLLGNYFITFEHPDIKILDFLHTIINNTVNGKPLYYITNMNNFIVPSDAGQIILVNCINATIKDLSMNNNDFSILLAYCNNCLLENLTISDTDGEVLFFECSDNIIQNNKIHNTLKAICIEYKSKNNIIRYNTVSNNFAGLSIYTDATNNSLYKNIAYDNEYAGIELITAHGGVQSDNNLLENNLYNNKYGILLYHNSIDNIIQKNIIKDNTFGVLLRDNSNNNIISQNNIQKNIIPSLFLKCRDNVWDGNYWNRPRILPKIILGQGIYGLPNIDIDLHPAREPYDI